MRWPLALGITAGAVALSLALALALGEDWSDALTIVAAALGGALAAEAVGGVALLLLRSRSLRSQMATVALTAVGAVASGATVSAALMFFSRHDFRVLLVLLVPAGTVGVLSALMLAERVARGSRSLGHFARGVGGDGAPAGAAPPLAGELAELRGELERMASRLDRSRSREQGLEAARRELVSWVSHDLRTPLAGIRALAEALEDGVVEDAETVARYLATIRREADTLAEMVDDLFALSRLHAGSFSLTLEPMPLTDLVSDALAAAGPAAEAEGVRLDGRVDGPLPEVLVSAPEIARVLRNLLDNAIRHSPAGSTVHLSAGKKRQAVWVSVTDACGGIPDDELRRVFEVGFRGDAARTRAHGGAGLGLAIARGLVEAHGGEVDATNVEGGCRFTVRLPVPVEAALERA